MGILIQYQSKIISMLPDIWYDPSISKYDIILPNIQPLYVIFDSDYALYIHSLWEKYNCTLQSTVKNPVRRESPSF